MIRTTCQPGARLQLTTPLGLAGLFPRARRWLPPGASARSGGRSAAAPCHPGQGLLGGLAFAQLNVIDQCAVAQPHEAIATGGYVLLVGGGDDRHREVLAQVREEVEHGIPGSRVEVAGPGRRSA
jgi:hypothetical protein